MRTYTGIYFKLCFNTCKSCKILHLDRHTTAPEQPDVGCQAVSAAAVTEMDGNGFRLFNSVSLLLPGSLGLLRWSLNAKTQAVKVYNVVKTSHVGQHSKDNTKYTVITVYR